MSDILNKNSNNKKNNKWKFKYTFILVILLIVTTIIGGKIYYYKETKPMGLHSQKDIKVVIPKGSSTIKIANILKENNLIRNELMFRLIAKKEGLDGRLKAGSYVLNNGLTPNEILATLEEGGILKETFRFTIPEGFELREIANRLSKNGLVDKEKFLNLTSNPQNFSEEFKFLSELPEGLNLEGYLYPDTYEIYVDTSEEEIIKKMLNRFEEVYSEEIKNKASNLNLSLNQVITLASIIEREGMLDEERPIISGVFHNRMKIEMPLESCATVQFLLGERKENLTYNDLEINSPYNTYQNGGLPPGPIASPGIKSIIAAVNPADVDYLFFVSNGDGSHTFSKNYNDHINAKNNR